MLTEENQQECGKGGRTTLAAVQLFLSPEVPVTNHGLTKAAGVAEGAGGAPRCRKGMICLQQFSLRAGGWDFTSRESYELRVTQQNDKLMYGVQSERMWRGKSQSGEILIVFFS